MMKLKRSIFVMIFLIGVLGMTGCGSSKKELKAELQEIRQEKQEIQSQLEDANDQIQQLEVENAQLKQSTGDSADQYLSAKFYQDGNYYQVLDSEFEFYSDKNCENSIGNDIRIISPVVDETQWKNGLMVCTVLSEQGYIYSVSWPDLVIAND